MTVLSFVVVDPSGECRPDLRLKGHQKEGYHQPHDCCVKPVYV